ncbi:hypothetical protein SKAU_G00319620 [Synaphobranchus kaupii]|uniref:Uncharacterized protein n=1 Tax=Synaphobranchus kaupii TaxID=118154 RepID=A0A9Q1ENF5_SYNKA|nr:hypothetical protein SKAU_G00319620 [Synaphobranchus kaupii]
MVVHCAVEIKESSKLLGLVIKAAKRFLGIRDVSVEELENILENKKFRHLRVLKKKKKNYILNRTEHRTVEHNPDIFTVSSDWKF